MSETEGLALIQPQDLNEWWFRYLFIRKPVLDTEGLGRLLNPEAFYIACRWSYHDCNPDLLRHCFARVVSPNSTRVIFARPVDWGPNTRTKRVIDLSPAAAKALKIGTDDMARADLILPIIT